MNHKLSLEASKLYGSLLNFVPEYSRDNFVNAFEKFLDAYDSDNAENLTVDVKVSEGEGITEKVFQAIENTIDHANFNGDVEKFAKANGLKFDKQRAIPKVGEIYRDTLNYRLKILAVLNDANGYIILMQNCSDFLKSSIRLMTLTDFEKLTVYKED